MSSSAVDSGTIKPPTSRTVVLKLRLAFLTMPHGRDPMGVSMESIGKRTFSRTV